MKSDRVLIRKTDLVERILSPLYDDTDDEPWPWGPITLFAATVTFPGDSMVRVQGEMRLYRWWHPWHHDHDNAPEGATWETHERAWYNPARWFEGKYVYELTSGRGAYHFIRKIPVDIVVPASTVSFTPAESPSILEDVA